MFFRAFVSSIALAITLLIAVFGVCSPAIMSGAETLGFHTETHTQAMICLDNSITCEMSFSEHLTFLNSLLPGLNQETVGSLLVLLTLALPLTFWTFYEHSRCLSAFSTLSRLRLKRFFQAFVQWFTMPTLTFAFSRGILHAKRYSA